MTPHRTVYLVTWDSPMRQGKRVQDLPGMPAGWGCAAGDEKYHYYPEESSVSLCRRKSGYRGNRTVAPIDAPRCGLCRAVLKS